MSNRSASKLNLRELHQEIDLYDRKIAHLNNYEKFEKEADRVAAVGKLAVKRETLAKQAREMASQGIEIEAKYLPRSFKAEMGIATEPKTPVAEPEAVTLPAAAKTEFGSKIQLAEAEQRASK